MQTLAIIQARTSSARLPQKVLKHICGQPMLALQIKRVQQCRTLNKLMVATSNDPSDQPIADLCAQLGVACYRGALDHVLDRMYQASQSYRPEHIVRLTGDCPVIDPATIDHVVTQHLEQHSDYTSNCNPPTYPDGLDVEVIRASVLQRAWQQATKASDKEHVTPYIYRCMGDQIKLLNITNNTDLSHLRWTVDNQVDFDFISWVYHNLYPANPYFTLSDILELCQQHPKHTRMNAHIQRNEGYQKALKGDQTLEDVL